MNSEAEVEALETFSKILTGSVYRLPLAAWIRHRDPDEPFFQREASDAVGAERQYMRRELDVLARLGLIEPLDRPPGEIRQFFVAAPDHPGWTAIDGAVIAARRLAESENP